MSTKSVDWAWANSLPSLSIHDAVGLSLGYEIDAAPASGQTAHALDGIRQQGERTFVAYEWARNGNLDIKRRTVRIGADFNIDDSYEDALFWEIDTAVFRKFCDDMQWAVPAEFLPQGYSAEVSEKPLASKERNILLAIIGVLCVGAKLDLSTHAKTAGVIKGMAASQGVSIGETTIENHLKAAKAAHASLMK
ncbi:hypothetical protein os1_06350 [Comamonadaceae bacterium OS-1]|nr:hypothetical protein os1_06350 [Comamonadaceae bacterium OS-1]